MAPLYISIISNSGINYSATIERVSDGYYRQDDAEIFSNGLAFSDKDILLTEGAEPNLGSYSAILTADTWDDGIYKLRIHNLNKDNRVDGGNLFGVVGGEEVLIGEVTPIYHANIQYIYDGAYTQDRYEIRWFKNGTRVTSGVTNPCLSVVSSSGIYLFSNRSMIDAGDGILYYVATSGLQTGGHSYEIIASGTINSGTRVYSRILGRDSIGV